jgi:hypothetical protein
MATSLFKLGEEYFVAFGTSSGELEIHKINFVKKRLEI